jgi:predicted aconitase with swiveling domain
MGSPEVVIRGRGVVAGYGTGATLVSTCGFMFAHGVDPRTGNIIDVRSDIAGENIREKVLAFPGGKGSTTGSAWLLETIRSGNGPAAILNSETDPIIATALIMAQLLYGVEIPLVDRLEQHVFGTIVKNALVQVDGYKGEVRIIGLR